jgi:alpha/beta hydrolase fold
MNAPIGTGRVRTEGDDLYYEVRGHGRPLLMIPPAGGDGWSYAHVADILADESKVITFDRRAHARSTMNNPQNFEISQQSRDAAAVLRAADEQSAVVFGNSSGAVIALDMAKTQPQAVQAAWPTKLHSRDCTRKPASGSGSSPTYTRPGSGSELPQRHCGLCSAFSYPSGR